VLVHVPTHCVQVLRGAALLLKVDVSTAPLLSHSASASGPAKTSYAFDQVLVWENEVMAKALSESSEKGDVVLMLQECFARLKMTAKANDKANLALEKINAGVSGMEALIKVFQRLQDAQEISQTVIGRGANETFDL
jgi:hypothetical protein